MEITLTYLNFLILFVVAPTILMLALWYRSITPRWWRYTALLCLVAFIWTTPWDNYLVATDVWWYDDAMVLGIVWGYVPLEEYAFFILQTIMTSVLLYGILRYVGKPSAPFQPQSRLFGLIVLVPLVGAVIIGLLANTPRLNYLLLEVGWLALPPLAVQYLWGLDILLYHWRAWLVTVAIATSWLAGMDMLAIQQGTWFISETQTTGIKIAGILPIEELIFFLITNLLIVQGMLLFTSEASWQRVNKIISNTSK